MGVLEHLSVIWEQLLAKATILLPSFPYAVPLLLALPVLLAIHSRRWTIWLTVCILVLVSVFTLIHPESVFAVVVGGAYAGGLIVALAGIAARRRARSVDLALLKIQRDVNDLLEAESQRFVAKLKSDRPLEEKKSAPSPTGG